MKCYRALDRFASMPERARMPLPREQTRGQENHDCRALPPEALEGVARALGISGRELMRGQLRFGGHLAPLVAEIRTADIQ
jgi:hypothetical protein